MREALKAHSSCVRALVFTADGNLVSGCQDGTLKKWDVETGAKVWSRNVGMGEIFGVCELADGRLVVGGESKALRVLDGATGRKIMSCRGHLSTVFAVISLGDLHAGSFASGSEDLTIRVWASDGAPVRVVNVEEPVFSLSLSPCGRFVGAGCEFGSVRVYRLPDGDLGWSMLRHLGEVWAVSWSPDGRFLASGSSDSTVKILDAATGAVLRISWEHSLKVRSVLFSQDGTKVLSGSYDNTVCAWRIFFADERRVMGLMAGVEVLEEDWEMREVCREIVGRMKRLWEVERE